MAAADLCGTTAYAPARVVSRASRSRLLKQLIVLLLHLKHPGTSGDRAVCER